MKGRAEGQQRRAHTYVVRTAHRAQREAMGEIVAFKYFPREVEAHGISRSEVDVFALSFFNPTLTPTPRCQICSLLLLNSFL